MPPPPPLPPLTTDPPAAALPAAPAAQPAAPPAQRAAPVATPLPAPGQAPASAVPVSGRLTLVLPAQATPFGRAAEAVRQGFFAAHRVSSTDLIIEVVEIDETPAQFAAAARSAAERGSRLVVGALTRSLANAVGAGDVALPAPALILNFPERDAALGQDALAFGLAGEWEARVIVATALRERAAVPPLAAGAAPPPYLVLAGESPLARRLAAAFVGELRANGQPVRQLDARIGYDAMQAVADQVAELSPPAIFLAMEAREAAALRPRLPRDAALYATSIVHLGGAEAALLAPDLEGVRFVDMPWLLEPDHPAVAVFPRPESALTGELQRLYALGIDAYRLAVDWLQGRRQFELDGVTGVLRVDRARSPRVERLPSYVVFRSGRVEARPAVPGR